MVHPRDAKQGFRGSMTCMPLEGKGVVLYFLRGQKAEDDNFNLLQVEPESVCDYCFRKARKAIQSWAPSQTIPLLAENTIPNILYLQAQPQPHGPLLSPGFGTIYIYT